MTTADLDSAIDKFQSTPSVGRATVVSILLLVRLVISIHALRGEGDHPLRPSKCARKISIHALRGEGDDFGILDYQLVKKFQSTPSVGRAT